MTEIQNHNNEQSDFNELQEPPLILENEPSFKTQEQTERNKNDSDKYKPFNEKRCPPLAGLTLKSVSFKDMFKSFKTDMPSNLRSTPSDWPEKEGLLKTYENKSELSGMDRFLPGQKEKVRRLGKNAVSSRQPENEDRPIRSKDESETKFLLRREGDWICAECKNVNFERRIKCNRCDKCKFGYDYLSEFEITEEDLETLYVLFGKDDWKCEICKNLNFGKRLKCHRCGVGRVFCDSEGNLKKKTILLEENRGVSPFSEVNEQNTLRAAYVKNNSFSNVTSGMINYLRKARMCKDSFKQPFGCPKDKPRISPPTKTIGKQERVINASKKDATKLSESEENESEKGDSTLDHLEEKPRIEDEDKKNALIPNSQDLNITEAEGPGSPNVDKTMKEEKIERKLFLEEDKSCQGAFKDHNKSPCLFEESASKKVRITKTKEISAEKRDENLNWPFQRKNLNSQLILKENRSNNNLNLDVEGPNAMKMERARGSIKFPINADRFSGSAIFNKTPQENNNPPDPYVPRAQTGQQNNNSRASSKSSILNFNWEQLKKDAGPNPSNELSETRKPYKREFARSRSKSKEKNGAIC